MAAGGLGLKYLQSISAGDPHSAKPGSKQVPATLVFTRLDFIRTAGHRHAFDMPVPYRLQAVRSCAMMASAKESVEPLPPRSGVAAVGFVSSTPRMAPRSWLALSCRVR